MKIQLIRILILSELFAYSIGVRAVPLFMPTGGFLESSASGSLPSGVPNSNPIIDTVESRRLSENRKPTVKKLILARFSGYNVKEPAIRLK